MKFDKSSQQAETSGVWSVYNLKPESSSSKQFPSVCLVCGVGCHCSAEERTVKQLLAHSLLAAAAQY